MLAFAKDISEKAPTHPEESKNEKLKDYMDYHRSLNHEKLVFYSLDHAKGFLQKNIGALGNNKKKLEEYAEKAFPVSYSHVASIDDLMTMLRKLSNAHNANNNWYRLNPFYLALVYDCINRFCQVYNRLVKENMEKASEYSIYEGDIQEIDFDDWVQLYFPHGDFLIGKKAEHAHFLFFKRIEAIEKEMAEGKEKGELMDVILKRLKEDFDIEPSVIQMIEGKKASPKDMELFYTSRENPIYEYLYETDSAETFMDGESLLDHSYFLSFQIKGLSMQEAQAAFEEASQMSKN